MRHAVLAFVSACLLTGCAARAPAAPAAAASFEVGALQDNDGVIQGCTRSLSRVGASPNSGEVFREDAIDHGAKGFIRIDGALIQVDLVSAQETDKGGIRTFSDARHTTRIVETLTTGAAHEEADSVEEAGTLAVTHNGATQTLHVAGGTAC